MKFLAKDYSKYFWGVGLLLIAALGSMELPHNDKSIFEYLIPTIKTSPSSRLQLSGILVIVLFWWSYNEIVKSNYFKSGRATIFIIMLFVISPILFGNIDIIKTPYYAFNTGLKTIEIVESKYHFTLDENGNEVIEFEVLLRNYGYENKDFQVALILPDSLSQILSERTLIVPNKYSLHSKEQRKFTKQLKFSYAAGKSELDLDYSRYWYDDYKIELFNGLDDLLVSQGEY